jgi:hypothetical protein
MPKSNPPSEIPNTRQDFKNSWQMLKENYKAFILTEIFALFAFITFIFVTFLILFLIISLLPGITLDELSETISEKYRLSMSFRLYFALAFLIIFMGFINSQFGLANDIMKSGEMFAEFKGSFLYFKKNWWQYFILTVVIYSLGGILHGPIPFSPHKEFLPNNLANFDGFLFILLQILRMVIYFGWFILTIHAFPSVTSRNQLKLSLKETFFILKQNPKRVIKTWGVYYLIFRLPIMILVTFFFYLDNSSPFLIIIGILAVIIFLLEIFVGFPLLSLLATGIYNNSPINKKDSNS